MSFAGTVVVTGLTIFVLHAGLGMAVEESGCQVRRAVDPTVLPTLNPDQLPPPAPLKPEPEPADSKTAKPEPQIKPEPVASPAPGPGQKADPEPKADAATPGIINSIGLDSSANGFSITIQANRPVGDTTYINLSSPRRLVIDLREKWTSKTDNVIRSKTGPVRHIVIGDHPDRLRLVVHFRTPPDGRLNPEFERKGNSLKVSATIP